MYHVTEDEQAAHPEWQNHREDLAILMRKARRNRRHRVRVDKAFNIASLCVDLSEAIDNYRRASTSVHRITMQQTIGQVMSLAALMRSEIITSSAELPIGHSCYFCGAEITGDYCASCNNGAY